MIFERPRVSLLVPAYQAEATLALSLRSIARQSFRDFECVVVDDGSTDRTGEIATDYARRDPRFRPVNMAHGGLVAALMRALGECRGEFVARMDADDVMHRDRLAAQLAAIEREPRLTAVGSHVRIFPRSAMTDGMRAYERWLNAMRSPEDVRREAFVECPIVHPTLFIRRRALAELGYLASGFAEDYELVLRLLEAGHSIGVVPRRLLGWRDTPQRFSRTAPECAQDRIVELKAEFIARGLLASTERYLLWGYGDTGRVLCRALAARGKRPSAIVELHAGRIGQTIFGAPVIEPDDLRRVEKLPLVASVAGAKARGEIRAALASMSFAEGRDFVCAA